jgi:hypothetical protein
MTCGRRVADFDWTVHVDWASDRTVQGTLSHTHSHTHTRRPIGSEACILAPVIGLLIGRSKWIGLLIRRSRGLLTSTHIVKHTHTTANRERGLHSSACDPPVTYDLEFRVLGFRV